MSFVVTPEQMRAAEQRTVDAGHPEPALMRAAAESIAMWVDGQFHSHGDEPRTAIGLVGPGKNGGDTLVALALLAEMGWTTYARAVNRTEAGDLPIEPTQLAAVEIVDQISPDLAEGTIAILDGIYGLGGRSEVEDEAAAALAEAAALRAETGAVVIAIDVPSGVDSATGAASEDTLRADATLAIGALKSGLMSEPAATLAGEVVLVDIGIEFDEADAVARMIAPVDVAKSLPKRFATAGKHDYGGLMVVGGAPAFFGAPRLAAEAGLLVGTGIVGAAVPRSIVSTIAVQVPELVFLPIVDSDARMSTEVITEAITGEHARYTAMVIGPGLGQDEAATALLDHLFGQATTRKTISIGFGAIQPVEEDDAPGPGAAALSSVPLVLDADALNWLASKEDRWSYLANTTSILTPHAGEMARLLEISVDEVKADRIGIARRAAQESGQVVVLKGGYTVVAGPDGELAVAQRATPELATPGTGDVLAGIIGGLLAQGMTPFDAACAGVWIGGEAGRQARHGKSSRSVLARDVLAGIGSVLDDLDGTIW